MSVRVNPSAVAVALSLTFTAPVAAQDRPVAATELSTARYVDPVNGISIEQAVSMGLLGEPDLQAIRAGADSANGIRQQAAARPNPTISAMRQQQLGGTDATTSAEIQWPLDLFRRAGRIAVADREREAAQLTVADRQRVLAADVRAAYGALLAAVRNLEIISEISDVNRRGYELLRARVEQGASAPLERNMADVERHRIESQQWLQTAHADAALIELKRLLGLAPDARLKVRHTLEALVQGASPAPVPANVSSMVAERSDVRGAEVRVRLADARIDTARREGRFDVGLYGGFMRMRFGFPQVAFGPSGGLQPIQDVFHSVTFGAMVMVPFTNRNQGAIAAARAERVAADRSRQARLLAAESEIASAKARDERARQALAVYTPGVRTMARENVDVVRQTYELGRVTLGDVLAEQRRYLDFEMSYTDALKAAFEARTALGRALGEVQ